MSEKLECEMCASSKWKSACPECNGTGYYTPDPDLLPCPFCGGKADYNNDGGRWDQVICGSCGCRGCEYPDSREKAAAAWNRRSPLPQGEPK